MTERDFVIDKELAKVRISSIIQHKLRVLLKCYTITNFVVNNDKTFTFKKNYKFKKVRIEDKNILSGQYNLEEINEELVLLKITVN